MSAFDLAYFPLASLHLAISVSVGTRPRFANPILASFRTAASSIRWWVSNLRSAWSAERVNPKIVAMDTRNALRGNVCLLSGVRERPVEVRRVRTGVLWTVVEGRIKTYRKNGEYTCPNDAAPIPKAVHWAAPYLTQRRRVIRSRDRSSQWHRVCDWLTRKPAFTWIR